MELKLSLCALVLERYNQLDESGVQRSRILLAERSGLKQLLDECRLLLLQLRDALTLISHLLGRRAGRQPYPQGSLSYLPIHVCLLVLYADPGRQDKAAATEAVGWALSYLPICARSWSHVIFTAIV